MGGERAERIERAIDGVAAAIFAVACGGALLVNAHGGPIMLVAVTHAALVAFLIVFLGLQRIQPPRRSYEIVFHPAAIPSVEPLEELLLTDRVPNVQAGSEAIADALLLDDALPVIHADSRVVQLFGPRTSTTGELLGRIDRHIGSRPAAGAGDASEALLDALTDLRRSLRNSA